MVSRLLGKLDVRRHLTSGALCAMAGAAIVVAAAAAPRPAVAMNVRLFMMCGSSLDGGVRWIAFPVLNFISSGAARSLGRLEASQPS